jgi:hypothetical protein
MNLAGMVSSVRDRISETTANFFASDAIIRWINDGQRDVVSRLVPDALVGPTSATGCIADSATTALTTTDGTVALPADFVRIISAHAAFSGYNESVPIRIIPSAGGFDKSLSAADQYARGVTVYSPIGWLSDGFLNVRPGNVAGNVTFRYVQLPSDISGTQTSIVPVQYHHLIVEYAVHVAKRFEREPDEANFAFQQYMNGISAANANYVGTHGNEPIRIVP